MIHLTMSDTEEKHSDPTRNKDETVVAEGIVEDGRPVEVPDFAENQHLK